MDTEAVDFKKLVNTEDSRLANLFAKGSGTTALLDNHASKINAWVQGEFSDDSPFLKEQEKEDEEQEKEDGSKTPNLIDDFSAHEAKNIPNNKNKIAYQGFPLNNYLLSQTVVAAIAKWGLTQKNEKWVVKDKVAEWLLGSVVANRLLYSWQAYGISWWNGLRLTLSANAKIIGAINLVIAEKSKEEARRKHEADIQSFLKEHYYKLEKSKCHANALHNFLFAIHEAEGGKIFANAYKQLIAAFGDKRILLQILKYKRNCKYFDIH